MNFFIYLFWKTNWHNSGCHKCLKSGHQGNLSWYSWFVQSVECRHAGVFTAVQVDCWAQWTDTWRTYNCATFTCSQWIPSQFNISFITFPRRQTGDTLNNVLTALVLCRSKSTLITNPNIFQFSADCPNLNSVAPCPLRIFIFFFFF